MLNKSLLTYNANEFQVEQMYYSPVSMLNGLNEYSLYCFISQVDPWLDDNNPPIPTQDQKYLKSIAKNIFAMKKVTSNNISPVVERNDWITNFVYDYYRDDVDMFTLDKNGFLVKKFYVKNRYDQVFKCLWNNNGSATQNEPSLQPGAYGTNGIFVGPDDGYKWKYLYTIDGGRKNQFMDTRWMPVPLASPAANAATSSVGFGGIETINVITQGQGYSRVYSPVSVLIDGDGQGATANVVLSSGHVIDVTVDTSGSNYTYANVSVVAANGAGAILTTAISPSGGHGFNLTKELGCNRVMVSCEFNKDEVGLIPIDVSYHQVGLMLNPWEIGKTDAPANGTIYKTTTDLFVGVGKSASVFISGELVYEGTSLSTASFIGTVLSFDSANNVLKVINTKGTPLPNRAVTGDISGIARTVLQVTQPSLITYTGSILYAENKSAVQRSTDGIEQFKIVLGY
jgi:hypothetical protein